MAAALGLDPKVWQLCTGVSKEGKKNTLFHNVISKISFYTLPPDEYGKKYSEEEELKCSLPKDNVNGLNRYFPKVIEKERLELEIVYDEELAASGLHFI